MLSLARVRSRGLRDDDTHADLDLKLMHVKFKLSTVQPQPPHIPHLSVGDMGMVNVMS